jgi:hypothetical protein
MSRLFRAFGAGDFLKYVAKEESGVIDIFWNFFIFISLFDDCDWISIFISCCLLHELL